MKRLLFSLFLVLFWLMNPLAIILAWEGTSWDKQQDLRGLEQDVVPLGSATDPQSGKTVYGYSITLYENNSLHVVNPESMETNDFSSGADSCFTVYSVGTKWKTIEPWLLNPANSSNLNPSFVFSNIGSNISKWENAADGSLTSGSLEIMGNGTQTSEVLSVDFNSPDGRNEFYFGEIPNSPSSLARTNVWGFFDTFPQEQREIIEWDIVINNAYSWARSSTTGAYDFESVATHEIGHAIGMNHPTSPGCHETTMWGNFITQDATKRSLEPADISGAYFLYGSGFSDLDNDGVFDQIDNCSSTFNPFQENVNREPTVLPWPIEYMDFTNLIGDNIGDLCDADMDHDYLSNNVEAQYGTTQNNSDSDNDGNIDGAEVRCGSDPLNSLSTVLKPSGSILTDTDHDRLPDICEAEFMTNPNLADSDLDGALDSSEVIFWGSNPLNIDSDSDACSDMVEVSDVNGDKRVNSIDIAQAAQRFASTRGDSVYISHFDVNTDGVINSIDLSQIGQRFAQVCK